MGSAFSGVTQLAFCLAGSLYSCGFLARYDAGAGGGFILLGGKALSRPVTSTPVVPRVDILCVLVVLVLLPCRIVRMKRVPELLFKGNNVVPRWLFVLKLSITAMKLVDCCICPTVFDRKEGRSHHCVISSDAYSVSCVGPCFRVTDVFTNIN